VRQSYIDWCVVFFIETGEWQGFSASTARVVTKPCTCTVASLIHCPPAVSCHILRLFSWCIIITAYLQDIYIFICLNVGTTYTGTHCHLILFGTKNLHYFVGLEYSLICILFLTCNKLVSCTKFPSLYDFWLLVFVVHVVDAGKSFEQKYPHLAPCFLFTLS